MSQNRDANRLKGCGRYGLADSIAPSTLMDDGVLPTGPWHFQKILSVVALCAAPACVFAQAAPALEELPIPEPLAAELPGELADSLEPANPLESADSAELPEPIESDLDTEVLSNVEPAAPSEPLPLTTSPSGAITNTDVSAMVGAEFSDSTIVSVIGANAVQFDLSPRALVALKSGGVSEAVIEAMIAAEADKKRAAVPPPVEEVETPTPTPASQEYARLTQMIEQLAAKQEAAVVAQREPEPPASRADPSPRVWLVAEKDKTPIAPTIAQVAFADGSKRNERFKNLQGLAGQALAFASPAVSGIATTIGSLFRPDEERTAVWALAATSSTRVLDFNPKFEIDFAHIPGVDPDRYQPAIVQLVPTNDNYRLVAAAETEGSNTGALPSGPIIEEVVATESTRIGRGQYSIAPRAQLGPGEFALVLRPIPETKRARRRNTEASLGELLGGSTSQILYLTWEFSIAPSYSAALIPR